MAIWGVARSKLQGFQHCGDFRGWYAQSPAASLAPQTTLVISGLASGQTRRALVGVATHATDPTLFLVSPPECYQLSITMDRDFYCQVVLTGKNEGGVEYRFVSAPYTS